VGGGQTKLTYDGTPSARPRLCGKAELEDAVRHHQAGVGDGDGPAVLGRVVDEGGARDAHRGPAGHVAEHHDALKSAREQRPPPLSRFFSDKAPSLSHVPGVGVGPGGGGARVAMGCSYAPTPTHTSRPASLTWPPAAQMLTAAKKAPEFLLQQNAMTHQSSILAKSPSQSSLPCDLEREYLKITMK